MNWYSYKTLNVYKEAKALVIAVYKLLKQYPVEERYALCDQIRRAAISITSNIAEGMSRYSDKEKVHFIEIAYASMMEVDSQLEISIDLGYITQEQYIEIEKQINSFCSQLSALRAKSSPQSTGYTVHHPPYTINESINYNTAVQQSTLCHQSARLGVGSNLHGL